MDMKYFPNTYAALRHPAPVYSLFHSLTVYTDPFQGVYSECSRPQDAVHLDFHLVRLLSQAFCTELEPV